MDRGLPKPRRRDLRRTLILDYSFDKKEFSQNLPPLGEMEGAMKKIKITLVKSPIDRPERQKQTLKALGLNKANAAKEVDATPQILGMVRKVEHLVKVEEV